MSSHTRERFFDPFTTTNPGTHAAALVADLQAQLSANAPVKGRKLSPREHARWLRTTDALLANLALAVLEGVPLVTALGRKLWTTADRYARHGVGFRTYCATVAQADAEDLARLAIGERRGTATTLTPTPAFRAEVHRRMIAAGDFGRVLGEELVVLTDKTADGRRAVDYRDDAQTRAMRAEVETANAFLTQGSVGLGNVPVGADELRLRRRFSYRGGAHDAEPWAFGGRVFAGWQTMRKRDRQRLLIDGEPTAEVDANAMFARLAAARFNTPALDDSDLYGVRGFEVHRGGFKLALVALLFAPAMRQFPKAIRDALPPTANTVSAVKRAMISRHAVFERVFAGVLESGHAGGEPIGFRLMRTESDVLLETLRVLRGEGVRALPLHDGLVVARRHAERAAEVFAGAAWRVAGAVVPMRVRGDRRGGESCSEGACGEGAESAAEGELEGLMD